VVEFASDDGMALKDFNGEGFAGCHVARELDYTEAPFPKRSSDLILPYYHFCFLRHYLLPALAPFFFLPRSDPPLLLLSECKPISN
jgi:hypothetical protein